MNSCQGCPAFEKSIFCSKSNDNNFHPQMKIQINLKKGQSLFNQNVSAPGMYCIKKGNIKICKSDINGNETIVRIANAGDVIGDDILINEYDSEKSATAITDSSVCYIDKSSFNLLLNNKQISLNLLKKTFSTLKKAEDHICSCHQKKVISRLSEFLVEMKNNNGALENQRWKIDINLSREELAMIIGTVPETVIRAFSELRKLGIVTGQKVIYINDLKKLENIASNNELSHGFI